MRSKELAQTEASLKKAMQKLNANLSSNKKPGPDSGKFHFGKADRLKGSHSEMALRDLLDVGGEKSKIGIMNSNLHTAEDV